MSPCPPFSLSPCPLVSLSPFFLVSPLSVFPSLFDLIEADVEDGVSLPVFVIEVPPLEFINGEALRFHRLAQRLAHAALFIGPAGIVRVGALGHLVVAAGHLDLTARARVVERQVYSTAPVVARALARIGHKPFLVLRRGVPEDFGHRPRAVAVKNQQPVTFLAQPAVGARQGFGGGALQKRAALFVNRAAEKVIRSGVANVESDRRVEFDKLDQVWFEEIAFLFRHFLCGGGGASHMTNAISQMAYVI